MPKGLFDTNTDFFLLQGSTHRMTEDYVITNDRESIYMDGDTGKQRPRPGKIVGEPFAITSDGCSGSSHTDIGARLLSLAAREKLFNSLGPQGFYQSVLSSAYATLRILKLPLQSLDATLLTLKLDKERTRYTPQIIGDGFVAGKMRDGSIFFFQYEFERNAPFYLRYTFDEANLTGYFNAYGTRYSIRYVRMIKNPQAEFGFQITSEAKTEFDMSTDLEGGTPFWFEPLQEVMLTDLTESVAVITDGAASFQHHPQNGGIAALVPPENIIWELMNFKRYGGTFVANRCSKAIGLFSKRNWTNIDDLGISAIYHKGQNNA